MDAANTNATAVRHRDKRRKGRADALYALAPPIAVPPLGSSEKKISNARSKYMPNSNITGRLLNARRVPIQSGYVICADVYEDNRNRFHDGRTISTSEVVAEDGSVVLTRNSIYEIESWAN